MPRLLRHGLTARLPEQGEPLQRRTRAHTSLRNPCRWHPTTEPLQYTSHRAKHPERTVENCARPSSSTRLTTADVGVVVEDERVAPRREGDVNRSESPVIHWMIPVQTMHDTISCLEVRYVREPATRVGGALPSFDRDHCMESAIWWMYPQVSV
jgi:hypothetical protein